jgi:hypothetical protein
MIVVGHHAPDVAGGRWNRPGIGWGDPVEGQAPIGATKSPPGAEGSGVRPILTRRGRLSVNDLSAIIHCRLVSRGLAVRISAFCAPRVPWSDMKLSLRDAPLLTVVCPTPLRLSVAVFQLRDDVRPQSSVGPAPWLGKCSASCASWRGARAIAKSSLLPMRRTDLGVLAQIIEYTQFYQRRA